tara:strand:- start:262 stop:852 length:591 start_codon:yes stop_codon:yes gene_type:complete
MAATIPFNGLTDSTSKLIKEVTASSSASVSFVNGSSDVVFDNTFDIYEIFYTNVHPATNDVEFGFKATTNGTDFGVATTASFSFDGTHESGGTPATFAYNASYDSQQSTGLVNVLHSVGNGNDESASGRLIIYSPASTTFVKHFNFFTTGLHHADIAENFVGGGYINTTSAVTGLQFSMSSGNIDAGTFKLIGHRT